MSYVDSEEFKELMERRRHMCSRRGCENRATRVYVRAQRNAHGGQSRFRYQRCDEHPIGADSVSPYSGEVRE